MQCNIIYNATSFVVHKATPLGSLTDPNVHSKSPFFSSP